MAGINTLSQELKSLEEQLVACMKCGLCQSVCPLFEQTHKESDVARGKLVLLESLMKEVFDNPQGVEKRLNKCLLCGSCSASCPSGVNVVEIFIKARGIITRYRKLPLVKKIIFRKMLAHPATFDRIVKMGARLQRFLVSQPDKTTGTAAIKLASPVLNSRRIIPFAEHFFQDACRPLLENSHTNGPKVLLFTGCLIDKIFPRTGLAAVKALLYHNIQVKIPGNQGCCGIPALAAGDIETFKTLLDHHLALFERHEFDYLVTACATCTSTIKKLWPSMAPDLRGNEQAALAHISKKTMDISQFLIQVPGLKRQKEAKDEKKKIVTYHDPCHLAKSLGVRAEPRKVLGGCSGYTFKEMTEPDRCCGMGGSFNLYHYDISSQIGNIKRRNIDATGCDTLATSCPACMMQISDMLSKGSNRVNVKHVIECYAEGLNLP
jgi:glycolate oxidase iron-sulfur subunit